MGLTPEDRVGKVINLVYNYQIALKSDVKSMSNFECYLQHCCNWILRPLSSIINHDHHQSLNIINHHQSLIIINHHQSLIIINHHQSLIIINHHQSLSIIINHHQSSSVIINHHQSLSIIINHHQSLSIIVINQGSVMIIQAVIPCFLTYHSSQLKRFSVEDEASCFTKEAGIK